MALTAHFDASDTDNIFTSRGNPPSGAPSDGSAIQQWDDESVSDQIADDNGNTSIDPLWRQSSPGLVLPCLDFDGSNDLLAAVTDDSATQKTLDDWISASAFTLMVALRVESSSANSGTAYLNEGIVADSGQFFGLLVKNDTGQVKLIGYSWDGAAQAVFHDISVNTNYVVCYRYDGTNLRLSVNGGTEQTAAAGSNTGSSGAMLIGSNGDASAYLNGRIGELKVWDTADADGALAAQIAALVTKWVTAPVAPSGRLALLGVS